MSICGKIGSDVHALIKELVIRRVEHSLQIHSNEHQHLVERTEVAHLRQRFYFTLLQALSFRTRHHLCRQKVALAGTRQLRSQGPVSVHAYRTKRVTRSEEREGANGVGGGIRVGGGNRDENGVWSGNGDVNVDENGDGAGTRTGVEANEGTQDGNGDGSGDGAETRTGTGVEIHGRTQDGNGDEDANGDGHKKGIGEGGGDAKKRKKTHKSCRRDQAVSFRTRRNLCKQRVALASTRQLRSQGPVLVHAHRIKRETESEERGGTNGVEGGTRVGGRDGDEHRVGDGNGDGRGDQRTNAGWELGRKRGMKRE